MGWFTPEKRSHKNFHKFGISNTEKKNISAKIMASSARLLKRDVEAHLLIG